MDAKRILNYLRQIMANNTREWFHANHKEYEAGRAEWERGVQQALQRIISFDPTVATQTVKDCTYRFNRDTRFSADKTPYKTHIACFLSSWGPKNSGVPGYYFQLGTEEAYGLKGTCNLGGGIFMPTPEALNAIRQEIFYCTDEFLAIMNEPSYKKYFGSEFFTMKKLQRVPKGYPADWHHADLLKYKDYCTSYTMPDRLIASEHLFDEVLKVWRASVPLNRFVQRAMEDLR